MNCSLFALFGQYEPFALFVQCELFGQYEPFALLVQCELFAHIALVALFVVRTVRKISLVRTVRSSVDPGSREMQRFNFGLFVETFILKITWFS